jgi:hypothetical protein
MADIKTILLTLDLRHALFHCHACCKHVQKGNPRLTAYEVTANVAFPHRSSVEPLGIKEGEKALHRDSVNLCRGHTARRFLARTFPFAIGRTNAQRRAEPANSLILLCVAKARAQTLRTPLPSRNQLACACYSASPPQLQHLAHNLQTVHRLTHTPPPLQLHTVQLIQLAQARSNVHREPQILRYVTLALLRRGAVEGCLLTALSDPFAEADEDTGETKQSQNYIHIRIQRTSLPFLPPLPFLSSLFCSF